MAMFSEVSKFMRKDWTPGVQSKTVFIRFAKASTLFSDKEVLKAQLKRNLAREF